MTPWYLRPVLTLDLETTSADPAARVEGAWPVIPHEAQVQEQTS